MKPTILAFGDSLTEGYGLASSQSFPSQLETLLQARHPGAAVINAGRSGDTTISAADRLPQVLSQLGRRRDLVPDLVPNLVIVELGANDLLQGIPLETTSANLDAILFELGRRGFPALLAQMEPPAFLGAFARGCAAIYTELGARHGVAVAPFLPKGIIGNPALTLRDRVHPNAAGTALIAREFLPAVERELDRLTRQAA